MPVDYAEVLKDLDSQIATLEAEVSTLRDARPSIVILRNKYTPIPLVAVALPSQKAPFSNLGPTAAIQQLLKDEPYPLSVSQITDKLRAGGLQTKGNDLNSNVASTISRMRDSGFVEKSGDGWRLKRSEDHPVHISPGAPNSFSENSPSESQPLPQR